MRWMLMAVLAAACLASHAATAAEAIRDFPQRPVRLVSPFAAGGNTDMVGRILAPSLSERLGQNVLVENRPGAGSMIGTDYVAKATPDGHTLLLMSGAFTAQAGSMKNLPFDPFKDFAWVSMVITYPFAVVVKADSPMRNVGDLVAAAKRNPGKMNYGSVGTGSVFHLAGELFNVMAGTEIVHIPYKGGAEPTTELLGGRIDVIFNTLTGIAPQVQAGRVRLLALASAQRSPQLPNVPTVAETIPGYEVTSFAGIAAPGATPKAVVAKLNREIRAVLEQPDMRRRLTELGGDVQLSSPEVMGKHVTEEIRKWRRIVESRRIEVQ